ncbi:MAG: PadR family transcriptional regulator [Planctomycetes bacterium]|nr:PadR family transcriptional regulator [Planctomycetota bacterium]
MPARELIAASSVPLVLAVLARGESYGYAILQGVAELSEGRLAWGEGMLYPVLHRLERDGLVDASWGRSEVGRERKYYRITAAGRAALARHRDEWLGVHRTLERAWGAIGAAHA